MAEARLAVVVHHLRQLSGTPAGGPLSGAVALANGVLRAPFVTRGKALAGLTLLLVAGTAGTGLAARGPEQPPPAPPERQSALAPRPAAAPRLDLFGDPLPPGVLVRLGTTRLRHGGLVGAVAFAPDGRTLASAGDDELIRLWNPATGQALAALRGHAGAVRCLAFSPDGKTLASGGKDKLICLWDVAAAGRPGTRPTQASGHTDMVLSLAFSADGKVLYSGGWDGSIRAWDPATGKELRRFDPCAGKVRWIALAPDGKSLASVNLTGNVPFQGTVQLWDPATGRRLRQLGPELKDTFMVAFSPDGATLAMADERLRVYEVASGDELHKGRWGNGGLYCVGFSPDGKTLVGGSSGRLRRWQVATGRELPPCEGDQNYFYSVAFTPDGKTLAAGGTRTVGLWDAATGKERLHLGGAPGEVSALLFTPDGRRLFTGGYGPTLRQWDLSTGKEVAAIAGAADRNSNAVLSPDGKTLVVQGKNLIFRLLDAGTGKELRVIEGHRPPKGTFAMTAMAFAFPADAKALASAAMGRIDNKIRLWDVANGKELKQLVGPANGPVVLAFAPDGGTLASAFWDGTVSIWDVATGTEAHRLMLGNNGQPHLAFAPDGRTLAVGRGTTVGLWDAATGRKLREWSEPQGEVASLAFSRDGRTLAVAGAKDGRARLWEVASGKVRLAVSGHTGAVKGVAFSPDGRLLATGGEDTTALIWDVRALPLLGRPAVAELSPRRLDELWADVAGADAEAAYRAVCLLARAPRQALPFLKERVGRADAKRLDKLIAQLDDDDFAMRERATAELIALGQEAEPAVRRAASNAVSAEARVRAETILEQIKKAESEDARRLRGLRTLEVLETIGTPEARRIVADVARGSPEAELAHEARAVLGRLDRASGATPKGE